MSSDDAIVQSEDSFPENTAKDTVSKRQGAEEPLAALQLRKRILAFTSCGVTLADARDPELPLIYVNQAFVDITGYSKDDILGRNCRILQGEMRHQEAIEEIRRALAEARSCKVLLRNFKKDGTPFWNELTMSPIFDERGRVRHFVGVQTDVTAREEAQADVLRLIDELDVTRREAERFADLVAGRLQQPLVAVRDLVVEMEEQEVRLGDHHSQQLMERLARQAETLQTMIGRWLAETKAKCADSAR